MGGMKPATFRGKGSTVNPASSRGFGTSVGYSTNGNNDTADLFASSGSNALFTDLAMAQLYGDMIRRGGANQAWIALDSPLVRSRMGEGTGFAQPAKARSQFGNLPGGQSAVKNPPWRSKTIEENPMNRMTFLIPMLGLLLAPFCAARQDRMLTKRRRLPRSRSSVARSLWM